MNKVIYLILSLSLLLPLVSGVLCDIVIAGGTLASLGAIIESPTSFRVCAVEPTGRLGG